MIRLRPTPSRSAAWILAISFGALVSCSGPVGGPAEPGGGGPEPGVPPVITSATPSVATVDVQVGAEVAFEVAATGAAGHSLTIAYQVNGVHAATGARFAFRPPAPGTYRVVVVAADGDARTTREWSVTVDPAPNVAPTAVLSIDPASGPAPLTVRLRVGGADSDGTVVRWRLELGGPAGFAIDRTAPIDTTLALGAGTYAVHAVVEDDRGATAAGDGAVTVNAVIPNRRPFADLRATPTTGVAPLDVVVEGSGSDPDGTIVEYALDLDDDGQFETVSVRPLAQSLRLAQAGSRWVRLLVTDDRGDTARDSIRVTATSPSAPPPPQNAAPTVELQLTPATGAAPLSVHAKAVGTDSDGSIVQVAIDFDGDGVADAAASGRRVEADRVFAEGGTFTIRATVVDDGGKSATATATVTVAAAPPAENAAPTGTLAADRTSGEATLEVVLTATGADSDGTVAEWEVDDDLGGGWVALGASRTVTVRYPYRDTPYRPRLRLTDDKGKRTVVDGPAISVHRAISAARSSAGVTGNARFQGLSIAPAVWADGKDAMRFTVTVRDEGGDPVADVPVRVRALRPELVAPDGTSLGGTVTIALDGTRTDAQGRITGSFTTKSSTRIEGMPGVGSFVPFGLMIEADGGGGAWKRLPDLTGLNAETTVSGSFMVGQFFVKPAGVTCVNQPLEIWIRGLRRDDAPSAGSPAADMFGEVRIATGGARIAGLRPLPGYEDWRTDANGFIGFSYTPRDETSQALRAWLDGQPINITAAFAVRNCP